MQVGDIMRAWGMILQGQKPTLSIEITKECPLRCPGCYAFEDQHLGTGVNLRQLGDFKGDELVRRILKLADEHRPLHLSLVGGDPLVRYREVGQVLPHCWPVESLPVGLQRVPGDDGCTEVYAGLRSRCRWTGSHPCSMPAQTATYERILKNISNQRVTIHCTITGQMMKRQGYLEEFIQFWSGVDAVEKVWFSMFTPQRGDEMPEILTTAERAEAIRVIHDLRERYPKVAMPKRLVDHFNSPPSSPSDCIFSQVTETISADFQTSITPCQFGGDPDCSQCGCMASMALAAVGAYKVGGLIPAGALFRGSVKIGAMRRAMRDQPAVNENRCGYSVGPTCAAAGDFTAVGRRRIDRLRQIAFARRLAILLWRGSASACPV